MDARGCRPRRTHRQGVPIDGREGVNQELTPLYTSAKTALAKLVKVDEVKAVLDKAKAMEIYARHAKDPQLATNAILTKKLARRRLGELIAEQRAAGKLAKGTRGQLRGPKAGAGRGEGRGKGRPLAG